MRTLELQDPGLLKARCYIDGQWVDADNAATLEVRNPATGALVGTIPNAGASETKVAILAAERAFGLWKARTAQERARILRRWFDLMTEHQEDLALLMTSEQGKPLAEARAEIAYAASYIEWFSEEARRIYGEVIPSPWPDKQIVVTRVPAGVFSVVTGDPRPIGGELTASPVVRKLTFTGSTEVGRVLAAKCAPTLKKMSLELGGNAPFIVFDDADLDAAVIGAMASKYRNSGQTCVCANRLLVQDGVYDAFVEKLARAVAALKVGNGQEQGVDQGPLIDEDALAKVEELVADACSKGARVVIGGHRHSLGRTFFEPTLLADVTPEMRVATEEIFGPIAPVFRFDAEADAIRMANDTEFGLAAYFYSRDVGRVWRVSAALQHGMVGVNSGVISTAVAPFGGVKQSGMGREGSMHGIDEYVDTKYLCMGTA